jgi:hypothetical protein
MSVRVLSGPVAPGRSAVVFALLPRRRYVVELVRDPPTAATFRIDRVDELTAGETELACGETSPALRIVVTNLGAVVAQFRGAVDTAPELEGVERQIGQVVERDWAAAYDLARREGRAPDAPIISLPRGSSDEGALP